MCVNVLRVYWCGACMVIVIGCSRWMTLFQRADTNYKNGDIDSGYVLERHCVTW